jgi:DNA-binding Xre family transcriptional regulator
MTTQHLYQGLTMAMRTTKLPAALGVERKRLWLLATGKQAGMTVAMLDQMHRKSGVSLDQLMAWYRLPEGAPIEIYRP